jgi:hypothetical protein
MKSITKKSEIELTITRSREIYFKQGISRCVDQINQELLSCKIRFPLLEYSADLIIEFIAESEIVAFCQEIMLKHQIGGNVLIGRIMWLNLHDFIQPTMRKAGELIAQGREWYVSDIIGERVFGNALLMNSDQAIDILMELANHPNSLVKRSIGAGVHLALKRGLDEESAEKAFLILLKLSSSSDYQVKRGIGWAAKTTARFYPNLIERHKNKILGPTTGRWFSSKVELGLARNAYDQRKRG